MQIRDAATTDLPAISAVYAHYVATSWATFDTVVPGAEHWEDWLGQRSVPGHHRLVAEVGDRVVAYAYATRYRLRPAYDSTREVSVYVAPEAVGQGLGQALYADLLERLRGDGMHLALAGIALPNHASRALHRGCGFTPVGVMAEVGHKLDRWVDVEWWQLRLQPS